MTKETIWHLQLCSPDELRAAADPGDLHIAEAQIKQYPLNRFLYQFIGGPWNWTDKLGWSDGQWQAYAESDQLRTWLAMCEGSPAGYFELGKQANGDIEICYFGLAEKFIGRRMGGFLLSEAIRQAWHWQAARVIVNTCSDDHPSALANYQARGMVIYKTEVFND